MSAVILVSYREVLLHLNNENKPNGTSENFQKIILYSLEQLFVIVLHKYFPYSYSFYICNANATDLWSE